MHDSSASGQGSKTIANDSQLVWWRRYRLLIINPRDAFALLSNRERIQDACCLFGIYFFVKVPVVVQNRVALGKLQPEQWLETGLGFVFGIIATAIFFLFIGALIHLLANRPGGSGQVFSDALALPALSLAPQLMLIWEVPFILYGIDDFETLVSVSGMRLIALVMSLRTFYWGLRVQFQVSRTWVLLSMGLSMLGMTGLAALLASFTGV
jgi:hypothetical protein